MRTGLVSSSHSSELQAVIPKFRSAKKKEDVFVYVEDYLDKSFWRYCLEPFTDRYEIVTCFYHNKKNTGTLGKDILLNAVEERKLFPSKNRLVCIDSDYDLLVDTNQYANLVRDNDYIITTGDSYSIENLKCTPENARRISYQLSLSDQLTIDFDSIFADVSTLFADLFLTTIATKNSDSPYSIDQFKDDVALLEFDEYGNITEKSRKNIIKKTEKIDAEFEAYSEQIQYYKDLIQQKEYQPETYYILMQGHAIHENFVSPLIQEIAYPRFHAEFNGVSTLNLSNDGKKDRRQALLNVVGIDSKDQTYSKNDFYLRAKQLLDETLMLLQPSYDQIQSQLRKVLAT